VSPTAFVLLLIAAFAHAGWNLAAKRAGGSGILFVWLFQTLSMIVLVPVAIGMLVFAGSRPRWSWLLAVVVAAALHNTYAVALQRGYAVSDLSVVYPVARGSGPLLSVVAAVVLLGERPGALGLTGGIVVALGILVIGLGKRPTANSVGWGAGIGVTVAAFTHWDAYSVTTLAFPPLMYYCGRAITQCLLLAPYALVHRAQIRQVWLEHRVEALIVACLAPLASVLVLYALRLAPVSVVAPAREVSVVIGTVVAWRWLGEPDPARRLTGAIVVVTGIAIIVLAAGR
jgi:drug/metabolite transporter (DMT)-like permease